MRKYKTYNDIGDLEFLQCYRQMLSQMNSLSENERSMLYACR
ncbi:hypothetical protein T11_3329 [Trichinella zimbabwensis]|uniref:Uncharacterized protein n=1 Tax=Trichinella zimbabwensis TaxID=268475 RepID=A0A0V1F3K4_9BILA|nr:hypothetical protein T11_3329 [Trichinella zimbabwensis]